MSGAGPNELPHYWGPSPTTSSPPPGSSAVTGPASSPAPPAGGVADPASSSWTATARPESSSYWTATARPESSPPWAAAEDAAFAHPPAWGPAPAYALPGVGGFSGLCAGGLAAAVLSVLAMVVEDGAGYSLLLSVFAVLLSGAALATTWDSRPSNRWMAVVGLTAGLAPLALLYLFAAIFTRGLFGV